MDEEQDRGPVTSRKPTDPPPFVRRPPPPSMPPSSVQPPRKPPHPRRLFPSEPSTVEELAARQIAEDEVLAEIRAEAERDPYRGPAFIERLPERIAALVYRLRRHPFMALVLAGSLAAGIAVAVNRSSADIGVYLAGALIGIIVGYSVRFVQAGTGRQHARLRLRHLGTLYDLPRYETPEYVYRKLISDALPDLYYLHHLAQSFAHPLLAAEIKATEEAANRSLSAGQGSETRDDQWFQEADEIVDAIPALRRRIRKAEWAYRLNLPLTRDAAANFAAARMAERIARLTDAMSSYVPSHRGGFHG